MVFKVTPNTYLPKPERNVFSDIREIVETLQNDHDELFESQISVLENQNEIKKSLAEVQRNFYTESNIMNEEITLVANTIKKIKIWTIINSCAIAASVISIILVALEII